MEQKGLTCKIPLDLHKRISEEMKQQGLTMGKFIEMLITEHYNNGGKTMQNGSTRTLAFQVSEDLFQRIKKYLEDFERVHHRRLTQKEFVIQLIEQALEEADEEFSAAEAAAREDEEDRLAAIQTAQSDEDGTDSEDDLDGEDDPDDEDDSDGEDDPGDEDDSDDEDAPDDEDDPDDEDSPNDEDLA